MPESIIKDFGHALYEAQIGDFPSIGKPLKGFGGIDVMELVLDNRDGTYRTVYTTRFKRFIIVLHAFQKKSKKAIATPKQEIDLIRARLKLAEEIYKKLKES